MNRVRVGHNKEAVCGSCKAGLPIHDSVVDGSDRALQTLIDSSPLPIVVDVWAPWCGPCRVFAPTFERYAEKYAGKIVFVKLNSEANQQTAAQMGIRGIPTIIIFKDGREIARQSGAIPGEQFSYWLDQNVK
jgi:thioredoxin 2